MANFNSLDQLGSIRDNFSDREPDEVLSPTPLESITPVDPIGKDNEEINDQPQETKNNQQEKIKIPQDIYLLGGQDAEMRVIKKKLQENQQRYFDHQLKGGAKIQDYSQQISKILEAGDIPVAIELANTENIKNVVDINHHDKKSNRPASLLQVMDRLHLKPSLFDELIAANDSNSIPAMEKVIERYRFQIESTANKTVFEELKNQWIRIIRKIDRHEQGITPEQEKQAEEAIKNRQDVYNGWLSIVHLPHSKCATVTDRLYGTYQNLLILSENGESNFYGNGEISQELKNNYEDSWTGGPGFGSPYSADSYWGGNFDQSEIENYVKDKVKILSENFSRFDSSFVPENFSSFTEIGKEIYKLGSFERMNKAVDVSNVKIAHQGKDFIIKLIAKPGWDLYSLDDHKLVGGYQTVGERRREAENTFGFSQEWETTPSYIFLQSGEDIPEEIRRGLQKQENIIFDQGTYQLEQEYYQVIEKFSVVKDAIKEKLETTDPRLLKYSLGKVDISVQQTWETEIGEKYYYGSDDIPVEVTLLDTCKDFELLGLGGVSTDGDLSKLKSGNLEIFTQAIDSTSKLSNSEIFTPPIHSDSIKIKEVLEKLKLGLNEFVSPVNREIQEKQIEYLERAYTYFKKQEEEVEQIKHDPKFLEQQFIKSSLQEPLELNGTYEDFSKLNIFLKGKVVALYKTYDSEEHYSEYLEKVGNYSDLKLDRSWGTSHGRFDGNGFLDAIENIDYSISFPADTFAVEEIITALHNAGYTTEYRGRSSFASRNSVIVSLPKIAVQASIVKYGESINREKAGAEKVWYCGQATIDINDPKEIEVVKEIVKQVKQQERNKEIEDFINEFKSKGDGLTAVLTIGGREKFQSVPERFQTLAQKRVANTQDHRQNRSHTYDVVLLDKEAIHGQKSIKIKIPDEYKGLVIGKGGQNIKRTSEELGIFIKVT